MSNLIHPVNKQPCEFVAARDGYVCLRLTCTVSPAVQWFTLTAIERANPVHTCALPTPLVVEILPGMYNAISHAIGVTLVYPQPPVVVRKPAPVISLYSVGMRAA